MHNGISTYKMTGNRLNFNTIDQDREVHDDVTGNRMMTLTIKVNFKVEVNTAPNEYVYIVGNKKSLGCWDISKALRLKRDFSCNDTGVDIILEKNNRRNVWHASVVFHDLDEIEYKFFVGGPSLIQPGQIASNSLVWESKNRTRVFSPIDYLDFPEKYDNQSAQKFE